MLATEIIKALLIGIIQGVTEWLPVSSTGHMILFCAVLPPDVPPAFWEMLSVVIQLGSVLAVFVKFFHRLDPFSPKKSLSQRKSTWALWGKIALASLPAAAVGFVINDLLDAMLYESGSVLRVKPFGALVIACALILYGAAFIADGRSKKENHRFLCADEINLRTALAIGTFQVLSLIPGTSRSGSTVLGARFLGASRVAAAEFSFFLAIPVMAGASLLKIADFARCGIEMTGTLWAILFVGCAASFLVSLATIGFLTDFVKKHTFLPFGVYRIILGIAVAATLAAKWR